jgi:hypothetical protein
MLGLSSLSLFVCLLLGLGLKNYYQIRLLFMSMLNGEAKQPSHFSPKKKRTQESRCIYDLDLAVFFFERKMGASTRHEADYISTAGELQRGPYKRDKTEK